MVIIIIIITNAMLDWYHGKLHRNLIESYHVSEIMFSRMILSPYDLASDKGNA